MPKNFANSALPPYEADGKRMPDHVWKFKRQQNALKALKLKIEGLNAKEISLQMEVSIRSAYLYLNIGKKLVDSGELTDDQIMALGQISEPVQVQRMRLMGRLRKSDEVIERAMNDYDKKKPALARNATITALAINKGLGVLVDTAIVGVGEIDVLAKRREDQNARLEAMKQFGLKVDAEVKDESLS